MSRLRALKGVASTLAAMFVSRNNDAAGYWAIGKLYRAAVTIGKSELEFNLLAPLFDEQQAEELQIVGAHYASALREQLRCAQLESIKLKTATIRVVFGIPEEKLQRYERFGYGDPIECVVELQSDSGHVCEVSARCRAAPHNPSRESRRHEQSALTIASSRRANARGLS